MQRDRDRSIPACSLLGAQSPLKSGERSGNPPRLRLTDVILGPVQQRRGHLFLVRADIREIGVDAWVLPTDTVGSVEAGWWKGRPDLERRVADWRAANRGRHRRRQGRRVELLPGGRDDSPMVVLGAVPLRGTRRADYHLSTVHRAVELVKRRRGARAGRPVIAVPALGTARSGGADVRGGVLADLVRGLRRLALADGVDVVLVLHTDDALSAARAVRRSEPSVEWWPELSSAEQAAATSLAARAVAGELTLFTGAGTSVAAGLPSWKQLIDQLEAVAARTSGLPALDLSAVSLLDRATIVADVLGEERLRDEVATRVAGRRYGLQHALLANLPVHEAVTLNYDRLLERAAQDAERTFAVLPYEPASGRWLLKLHGDLTDEGGSRDVVLTRADYLGASTHRAALTGLVQAVLTTRHLLFVGFGLSDDHVHALVHDVRTALGHRADHRFGTALLVHEQPALDALWSRDLSLQTLVDPPGERTGRKVEMFLDLLAGAADPSYSHLFDPSWEGVLSADERRLRELVVEVGQHVPVDGGPAWDALRGALGHYGWMGDQQ